MKSQIFLIVGIVFLSTHCCNRQSTSEAISSDDQAWVWLFDGSSTDKWRDIKSGDFPTSGWEVNDGILTVLGETEDQPGGHDIITKELFGNFELELEVRITEGANSGIKYQVTDAFPGHEGSFLGLEYQLLDNQRHPDAEKGRDGNHKMAALYDMIPPPGDLKIHPPGKWNKVRILLDGNKVEHWFNEEKVLEFDRKSLAFTELVSLSKYRDLEKFGELDEGHILLQGHGNDVSFRNIRIRTW